MILTPSPKQQFFGNNGRPLDGGLVFTYAAGTNTKLVTYQNEGGTPNTNPIVLDFRGEANIWLDAALKYKFVLSPRGDTDPPTNPIWSVDNIAAGLTVAELTQQFLGRILWPRTQAEINAGVTPTNYAIPSHAAVSVVYPERYGGAGDNSTFNDVAFANALAVANEIVDGVVAVGMGSAGVWLFDEPLLFGGTTRGARIVGIGKPNLKFLTVSISSHCMEELGDDPQYRQIELRNLVIDANTTGLDALVLHSGDYPTVDNVEIRNSQRHAFGIYCAGFQFIENGWFNSIKIVDAGVHAVAMSLAGANGAFINECLIQNLEVRGWSRRDNNGHAIAFDGNATGGASKFGTLTFLKSNFDAEWNVGDPFTPSFDIVRAAGSQANPVQNPAFVYGGWENTGTGNMNAGYLLSISGSGVLGAVIIEGIVLSAVGGQGIQSGVVIQRWMDYTNLRITQMMLSAAFDRPMVIEDLKVFENNAVAGIAGLKKLNSTESTATPSAQTDGVPLDGQIQSSASIATSSSGNLDFLGALTSPVPSSSFTHTFVLHLSHSQFAASGNVIMRGYHVIVRPDLATVVGFQIWDNSTANEIASVTFSIVNTTTLRVAITTGTAHGTGGGFNQIQGTLVRGAFV